MTSRHPGAANYNRNYYKEGEMGEVIEWLIYGFLSQISVDGDPSNPYRVICWGSNEFQKTGQIQFGGYAGTKFFNGRPPIRMTGNQLRGCLAEIAAEEAIYKRAEAESSAVYQIESRRRSDARAQAMAIAVRDRIYRQAGRARMELFRLKPARVLMPLYDEEMGDEDEDEEDEDEEDEEDEGEDEGEGGGDDDDDNGMEIDMDDQPDPEEYYTSQQIPRTCKRYKECIRRLNAERNPLLGPSPRARVQGMRNNKNVVPKIELGVPASIFPQIVWEFLRIILAVSLPVVIFWVFQRNFNWIRRWGFSLKWDLIFVVYACCFALPLHITRRLFPWVGQAFVSYGHILALLVAWGLYWDWHEWIGLPLDDSSSVVPFWGFFLLGLWRVLRLVALAFCETMFLS